MSEAMRRSLNYELDRVPQPLAEDLDHRLATAALHKYETRKNPSGLLRSAWNFVEYALNPDATNEDEKEEHLRTTQLLTAMAMNHPKASQDTILGSLTLTTYLPLFNKRRLDRLPTNQDCENVYKSLGLAMNYLRPLDIDEPPQWRMTEIGMLALSARSRQPELLMYPASPREESSSVFAYNHDSYFYNGKSKIPVQQKLLPTQKVYDEWVRILAVQPLLDRALKRSGSVDGKPLAEKVNHLLSLIVAETSGKKLTRDEMLFLNVMTEAVVAHRFGVRESDEGAIAA